MVFGNPKLKKGQKVNTLYNFLETTNSKKLYKYMYQ